MKLLLTSVFILFNCILDAHEIIDEQGEIPGIKIVAIPSNYSISPTKKLRVILTIVNESEKEYELKLKCTQVNMANVFSKRIEGVKYQLKENKAILIGTLSKGSLVEGVSRTIKISKHSSYAIEEDFGFVPFSENLKGVNGIIGVFSILLGINDSDLKSNDFVISCRE